MNSFSALSSESILINTLLFEDIVEIVSIKDEIFVTQIASVFGAERFANDAIVDIGTSLFLAGSVDGGVITVAEDAVSIDVQSETVVD